jgi:dienelactone hydrolase
MNPRTFEARDAKRGRTFPIDVWEGDGPLIVYSHPSVQNRRSATYLCEHLCSHGYRVAALDHSESVEPKFKRPAVESEEERVARWQAVIDARVPDIRFLLDQVGAGDRVGIVGHSFGGWTALAVPDVDPRIAAIVALAPGGTSNPRPGILPVKLDFRWGREIPTLIVAAENDTATTMDGIFEIFDRAPEPKRLAVLHRADHMHFVDETGKFHEMYRTPEMLPMSELTPPDEAHRLVAEWTRAHFDEFLLQV